MAAWRPYNQIVVPDVCFLHSVGNGEPHYGHLHGRSPFPSIAASETRLGSNSERLFVGFHDFGDSTFIPPAPSVFIDTSATGPVEYVENSGEPLFWIFVTWKIQVRGSPGSLQSWIVTFSKRMCSHFCKTAAYDHASAPLWGAVVCHLWHRMFDSTRIKLLCRCEARSYATYDVVCSTQRESNSCAVVRRGRMLPMTSYVRLNENQTSAPLWGAVVCHLWLRKAQAAYPQASSHA